MRFKRPILENHPLIRHTRPMKEIPEVDLSFIDAGFYPRTAVAGFDWYLKKGIGAFFFTDTPDLDTKDALIEEHIEYIPLTKKTAHKFPVKALRMVGKYNPKKEVIFVSEYKDGTIEVRTMGENILTITPIDAYREMNIARGKGRFISGELLILKKPFDNIPKGHYIFLNRTGAFMELTALRNGRTRKGDIKVHSDFEENFRGTGEIVKA